MGKQIPLRTTFNLPDGREIALETGKLAAQADGSVLIPEALRPYLGGLDRITSVPATTRPKADS